MSKIDWDDVKPEYTAFCDGEFITSKEESKIVYVSKAQAYLNTETLNIVQNYEQRPPAWPESDERMDVIGQNGNDGLAYEKKSKYERDIIGLDGAKTTIDVYRVLDAYKTDSPAIDHAVKKLLCAGIRHQKDRKQDLQEAIDSIAAELLLMSQR